MSTLTATLPMTSVMTDALKAAEVSAKKFNLAFISGENLLVALTEQTRGQACEMLSKHNPANIKDRLEKHLKTKVGDPSNATKTLKHDQLADKLLLAAIDEAQKRGDSQVGTGHLILAMLKFPHSVCGMYLTFNGLNYTDTSANSNVIFARNKEDALTRTNTIPAPTQPFPTAGATDVAPKRPSRSRSKVSSVSAPCGPSCGCNAPNPSLSITPAAPVTKPTDSVAARKAKWQEIFDIAWELSQQTKLSIPAAFIQASLSAPQLLDKEAANIIRKNAINDVAQKILELA